ncbi:MAG: hypothetical protein PHD65_09415 [Gallionella sp.]|nr:hypothetical protein [Gallionella sp.]
MHARFIVAVVAILLMGCATTTKSNKPERSFNATSLTVDLTSNGRRVLGSVPEESAMEHFEMIDPQGRIISYVSFTDTDTGALVFINQKLYGTLSHHDAQVFYSCRGYATATSNHWAHEAADWAASLLASSTPATEVKLEFSGKSTVQSIKDVTENSLLKQVKSFLGMGSSPLGVFSSLNTARNDMNTRGQFDDTQKGLSTIMPGMSELRVAEVVKPEDVSFASGGMVMAYPSQLVEYYVTEGVVKVIQHPSFHYLSRTRAALFYTPNTKWSLCTPLHWKEALPETP